MNCKECHKEWSGNAQAHCCACHQHFSSEETFTKHQRDLKEAPYFRCIDPSRSKFFEYNEEFGMWMRARTESPAS